MGGINTVIKGPRRPPLPPLSPSFGPHGESSSDDFKTTTPLYIIYVCGLLVQLVLRRPTIGPKRLAQLHVEVERSIRMACVLHRFFLTWVTCRIIKGQIHHSEEINIQVYEANWSMAL